MRSYTRLVLCFQWWNIRHQKISVSYCAEFFNHWLPWWKKKIVKTVKYSPIWLLFCTIGNPFSMYAVLLSPSAHNVLLAFTPWLTIKCYWPNYWTVNAWFVMSTVLVGQRKGMVWRYYFADDFLPSKLLRSKKNEHMNIEHITFCLWIGFI